MSNLLQRIARLGTDLNKDDRQFFNSQAQRFSESGWSDDDIVRYLSLSEEVNPELDEDVALRRMEQISGRYA